MSPFLWERVRGCLSAWEDLGASKLVREWIRYGYRVPFLKRVQPFYQRCCPPTDPSQQLFMELLEVRLLEVGAIELAISDQFVSKSRLVPKRDGGFRLVVDLRHINSHFAVVPCKFEPLVSLRHLVRPGDWFFSLDLRDGYYHLSIHPSHRKFFTTVINGRLYQFVGIPFGVQSAPFVFTKVMRVFVRALRARGLRVLPYLDDFLVVASSQSEALQFRAVVSEVLSLLGLTRNELKGQWEPAQSVTHLGVGVDSVANRFFVPPDKMLVLKASAKSLVTYALSHRRWVQGHRLESFIGFSMSLLVALQQVRTRTRSLYDALARRSSRSSDCQLSHQQLADLQWFVNLDESWNGLPLILPTPSVTMSTDASDFGWGASISGAGEARGFFGPVVARRHITYKELFAVQQGLLALPSFLEGRTVSLLTDNQAVMAIINKGASRSAELMPLCRGIQALLRAMRVSWVATYIRSADNVEADRLSRVTDPTDWTVTPAFWQEVLLRFGPMDVDRCSTVSNALCLRFNSRDGALASLGDCLLQSWVGATSWVNPPWALIPRLIAKVVSERAPAVLLLPHWESAPWWPLVVHHSSILWEVSDLPSSFVVTTNPVVPQPLRNPAWRMCVARLF